MLSALGVGAAFSRVDFQAVRDLSQSMPQGCMWSLGYPAGAAAELLDVTFNLRYCTTSFSRHCPLHKQGGWVGQREEVATAHLVDGGGSASKRVQKDNVLAFPFMVIRTQGFQRQSDGKYCISLTPQELGEEWACLAIFFLALGVVEACAGDPCSRRKQALVFSGLSVQPKGWMHACA